MHFVLIDAMSYGALFIFAMIGVLGLSIEMALRRISQ